MKDLKEIPAVHNALAPFSATDTPLWAGGVTFMQDNTEEIWKDVVGYDGLYQISNFLRVKSFAKNNHKKSFSGYLKHHFNGHYYGVKIFKDGKPKYHKIHKIFAEAFIPNPENKPFINHKNGIKTDNRIENLEWVTSSENQKHSHLIGLSKKSYARRKPVTALSIDGSISYEFVSTYHASKFFNKNSKNGSRIISSIKCDKVYKGFKFKYT